MSRPLVRRAAVPGSLALLLLLSGCAGIPVLSPPDAQSGGDAQGSQGMAQGAEGSTVPQLDDPAPVEAGSGPGASSATDSAGTTRPETPGVPVIGPAPVAASDKRGYLVRYAPGTSAEEMKESATARGATFGFAFKSLPIAYVETEEGQAFRLREDPKALHVEANVPIEFYDTESRTALRQHLVVDPLTGLKDAAGNPVDGRGIGVAVVDSGIDALHSDLGYAPLGLGGVVQRNIKFASAAGVALPDTDTTSGHGTHVATIVAGQGTGNPHAKGVAPGARLYGLGVGDASSVLWAAAAFDWVLLNHNTVMPPIKVVTNSWGSGTAYDPNSAVTQFANAMVDAGLTVVFAAGNGGGNGASAQTSSQCQIPKAGVICVAAFDDLGTGTRNGNVAPYSSRGATGAAATWPDISAPGTAIYSARPPAGTYTGSGIADPHYVSLSGTSQAAPHVAGVVALMLQKHPGWSPATVEGKLKCTAYKFTDGASYVSVTAPIASCSGPTSSLDKGFGLADAYAAVASS